MITIRSLGPADLRRCHEVDRTEHVTGEYVVRAGTMQVRAVDIHVGPWRAEPPPGHDEHPRITEWRGLLERGGILLGAFVSAGAEADALAGFAMLLPELEPGLADLALLYVDAAQRGRGVGSRLTDACIERARSAGARRLYVSATPTVATVDFYRGRGFEVTSDPHPAMFAKEPEDIHMILDLA